MEADAAEQRVSVEHQFDMAAYIRAEMAEGLRWGDAVGRSVGGDGRLVGNGCGDGEGRKRGME